MTLSDRLLSFSLGQRLLAFDLCVLRDVWEAFLIRGLLRPSLVLLFCAPIPHVLVAVRRLGQTVCQIEQVFGDSDRAEQLVVHRLVFNVIVVVVHEKLLSHADHCWVLKDLLASRS